MKIYAPAKLNLFLYVLRKRADGYHDIKTLFQKITLCDQIELEKATGITLEVIGEAPAGRDNLCFRAAEAFLSQAALEGGVFIRLRKKIPPGTGLGGASSDAAAVLKGLAKLYPGHLSSSELWELGRRLGADVPFFLSSYSTALGEGIGERLSPWPTPSAWYVVLVPPFRISTAWAYRNLRLTKRKTPLINGPEDFSWGTAKGGPVVWTEFLRNDFKDLVWGKHPELREPEKFLRESGALGVGLSGSGSALFGVFDERARAEAAAQVLRREFEEYQVFVVTNYEEGGECLSIT